MDKDLKLREATNSFITKQYYDGTSGSIESYRRAFYEGAKSDAAKEYHKPEWVSVKTPPPVPHHNCWAHYYWGYIPVIIDDKILHMVRKMRFTMSGQWFYDSTNVSDQVTHWMELNTPEPPINSKTTEG